MNNNVLTADVNSKVNLVKSIANKTRGPYTPEKYGSVIIPMAIMGEIHPVMRIARPQVNAGSSTSWLSIPRSTDFGFLKTSTKMPGLMPSATPYITKARMMLIVFIPPAFSVTLMLSMVLITSGAI